MSVSNRNRIEHRSDEYDVRLAHVDEVPMIPAVERAAARLFDSTPHADAVGRDVTPLRDLREAQDDGRLWVAVQTTGPKAVVGFALVEHLGAHAHLDELDVHPQHGRRGLGSRLVDAVCRWAQTQGFEGVTLTTYEAIAWNAPFYTRLGFETLDPANLPEPLAERFRTEDADGLDAAVRICMRYPCRA